MNENDTQADAQIVLGKDRKIEAVVVHLADLPGAAARAWTVLDEYECGEGRWFGLGQPERCKAGHRFPVMVAPQQPSHRMTVCLNPTIDIEPAAGPVHEQEWRIFGVVLARASGASCQVKSKGDFFGKRAGYLWTPSTGWTVEGVSHPWLVRLLPLDEGRSRQFGPGGSRGRK